MVVQSVEAVDIGYTRSVTVKVTDKMVRQFADLSGDHNPIHLDDAYAAQTKFKKRIAHGMISGALISRALVECIGTGGIYLSQNMKFVNPVFIDDEITITLTVTAIRKEKRIATVDTNVVNSAGDMVVKGEAIIMMGAPS